MASIDKEELHALATETERALFKDHEGAKAFYRENADRIGKLLDSLQELYPEHDGPLDEEAREVHEAAETLGLLYAALASYALTGEQPPEYGKNPRVWNPTDDSGTL